MRVGGAIAEERMQIVLLVGRLCKYCCVDGMVVDVDDSDSSGDGEDSDVDGALLRNFLNFLRASLRRCLFGRGCCC